MPKKRHFEPKLWPPKSDLAPSKVDGKGREGGKDHQIWFKKVKQGQFGNWTFLILRAETYLFHLEKKTRLY